MVAACVAVYAAECVTVYVMVCVATLMSSQSVVGVDGLVSEWKGEGGKEEMRRWGGAEEQREHEGC